ncbi:MAG: peptidoglycan DD-metalloendopeptidase family protein [Proteobacteria bacterium]|nr:peptidoglycan DD-metalloendopeptidase family protein [Pseudomonadota bacterium]
MKKIKKLLQHRVYISVALSDTGRARSFSPRLVMLKSVVALAIAGFVGFVAYENRPRDVGAVVVTSLSGDSTGTVNDLRQRLASVEQEKSFQDQQIQVFAQQLGVLQARLERFDAISEKLFDDKYFGEYLKGMAEFEPIGSVDMPVDERPVTIFELTNNVASLKRRADGVERMMETSLDLLSRTQMNRAQQPHIWPVVHERTWMSSQYGWRRDPFTKKRAWHGGVDIAGGQNAPVVASSEGIVTYAGFRYGYGLMVELRHAGGFITRYAHLNKVLAKNGQSLAAGEILGLMGASGRSTGPHLHFEVLVGDHKIDPEPFIKGRMQAARMLARSTGWQEQAELLIK